MPSLSIVKTCITNFQRSKIGLFIFNQQSDSETFNCESFETLQWKYRVFVGLTLVYYQLAENSVWKLNALRGKELTPLWRRHYHACTLMDLRTQVKTAIAPFDLNTTEWRHRSPFVRGRRHLRIHQIGNIDYSPFKPMDLYRFLEGPGAPTRIDRWT